MLYNMLFVRINNNIHYYCGPNTHGPTFIIAVQTKYGPGVDCFAEKPIIVKNWFLVISKSYHIGNVQTINNILTY